MLLTLLDRNFVWLLVLTLAEVFGFRIVRTAGGLDWQRKNTGKTSGAPNRSCWSVIAIDIGRKAIDRPALPLKCPFTNPVATHRRPTMHGAFPEDRLEVLEADDGAFAFLAEKLPVVDLTAAAIDGQRAVQKQ
jgi:hypothetical protein